MDLTLSSKTKRSLKTKRLVAAKCDIKGENMSKRFEVRVQTPGGTVSAIVFANNQHEALNLVRSQYASLLATDKRYHVITSAKCLD